MAKKKKVDRFEIARKAIIRCLSSDNYEEGTDLWDVLTALRGPDDSTKADMKALTTAKIRASFLGEIPQKHGMSFNYDNWNEKSTKALGDGDLHFQEHIQYARQVLFRKNLLKWDDEE